MRVALFVTCLADALFPQVGQATVTPAGAARPRGRLPRRRRPAAARCTSTPATSARRCRWCATTCDVVRRRYDAIVAPSGSCVGSVRHQHAHGRPPAPATRARRAGRARSRPAPTSCRSSSSTCSASTTSAPTSRTGSPTTRPATRCGCCGSATSRCGCCAHVRGIDLVELPDADQCCGFGGTFALKNADTSTAMLADKMRHVLGTRAEVLTAGDSSCLMHIGGGLSRLRAGTRTLHLAEILAATRRTPAMTQSRSSGMPALRPARGRRAARRRAVPDGGPHGAGRHPAAPQPRPRHRHHPRQARRGRRRGARLGGAAPGRRGDQGRHHGPPRRAPGAAGGARSPRAAAPCTGPATPTRPTGSSPSWSGPPGRTRSSRSSRWRPRRSGSTRRSRRRASPPCETDLAELIVQLGHDTPSHILVPGDPPQPRRDPRDLPARDARRRPDLTDEPRRLAMAARAHLRAQVPHREGRGVRAPTSPSPRPARCAVVESEGNGRMCLTLPRDPDHRHGHREGRADLAPTSRCSCSCCRAPPPASG